MADPGGRAV